MKNFIATMLSDSKAVSSKRTIAIVALLLLVAVVAAVIIGKIVDSSVFYALTGLITGNSALTLGERTGKAPEKPSSDQGAERVNYQDT